MTTIASYKKGPCGSKPEQVHGIGRGLQFATKSYQYFPTNRLIDDYLNVLILSLEVEMIVLVRNLLAIHADDYPVLQKLVLLGELKFTVRVRLRCARFYHALERNVSKRHIRVRYGLPGAGHDLSLDMSIIIGSDVGGNANRRHDYNDNYNRESIKQQASPGDQIRQYPDKWWNSHGYVLILPRTALLMN